jgi:hypothetical protein
VELSPHYALLLNAETLMSHTGDYQLSAGCGFSQSLLVEYFDNCQGKDSLPPSSRLSLHPDAHDTC